MTREPVARMTSVACRTRSPPPPGVPSSPGWLTRTLLGTVEPAAAGDPGDLVLVDEGLEPGPHPLDDLVAPGGHRRVVDGRLARQDDAVVLGVADAVGEGRRFEQGLGRDAAAMQARAADLVLVDEGDLEPELGGAERRRVAAGARAEHDEIEVVGGADGHGSGCLGAPRGRRRTSAGQVGHRGRWYARRRADPQPSVRLRPRTPGRPGARLRPRAADRRLVPIPLERIDGPGARAPDRRS